MRQTLDNAGAPLANASYDPWGTPQGSAISPFGFTGELQDAAGLTYLRARWYTPGTGTLLGVDPFEGFPEQPYSQNPYAYAIGDPIRYTDPSGRCFTGAVVDTVVCWSVVGGIITLAAGGVVANDPAARSAADEFGRRSAIALQHMGADAARGARFISSGEWWPDQEFFPLPPQEGRPFRLGPDLDEYCASLPGGFSLEQLDPSWWLRPGPALDGGRSRWHTGSPTVGEPPTIALLTNWNVGDPIDQVDANGNYPSWETVRERYWQNRANNAQPGEFAAVTLANMRNGNAPRARIIARSRATGQEYEELVTKELHHIAGRGGAQPHDISNLLEVWPWEHEAIDPYRHLDYDFVRFRP